MAVGRGSLSFSNLCLTLDDNLQYSFFRLRVWYLFVSENIEAIKILARR